MGGAGVKLAGSSFVYKKAGAELEFIYPEKLLFLFTDSQAFSDGQDKFLAVEYLLHPLGK